MGDRKTSAPRDPASSRSCHDPKESAVEMEGPVLRDVDFREKAISAAGAAFISAVIVNPLDVAKTRLQAQAAGVPVQSSPWHEVSKNGSYRTGLSEKVVFPRELATILADQKCPPVCPRIGNVEIGPLCAPACFQYKGTWDVFSKVTRQEGFFRLWRGTGAALAIAIPTVGIYLPCYDVLREKIQRFSDRHSMNLTPYSPLIAGSLARSFACIVCSPIELAKTRMQAQRAGYSSPGVYTILNEVVATVRHRNSVPFQGVRLLWTGVGAQLARDVPFSAICWSILEPMRQRLLKRAGCQASVTDVLCANIAAGVVAGSIAAAATCPLDVVKTRRQIERDPLKSGQTSISQTLVQVWREGGVRNLFTGVGPRVARAGPSVAIVVSFYEAVKYFLHRT